MSKFNVYMNSHFSGGGCRLIARARDTSRQRNVCLYAVPGHFDVVGVSDGTDAWIAPAAAGPFFKTATGDCARIMAALQAGEPLPPVPDAPAEVQQRRRVLLADSPGDPPPPTRRRILLTDAPQQQATTTGRRRVTFS